MQTNSFQQITDIIRNRHTTKAAAMNGQIIPDRQVQQLMELADWAPTHGKTEPWRFFIFGGEALKQFGRLHADLYWSDTDEDKRTRIKYDKLILSANKASHLIITVMKRSIGAKIPALEEMAAVAAAAQNILLGATALGIASIWSTGGMTYHPSLKKYLGIGEEDKIMGLLYLGYEDEPGRERKRQISLEEKVIWVKDPEEPVGENSKNVTINGNL
jgi:nitroreductase